MQIISGSLYLTYFYNEPLFTTDLIPLTFHADIFILLGVFSSPYSHISVLGPCFGFEAKFAIFDALNLIIIKFLFKNRFDFDIGNMEEQSNFCVGLLLLIKEITIKILYY